MNVNSLNTLLPIDKIGTLQKAFEFTPFRETFNLLFRILSYFALICNGLKKLWRSVRPPWHFCSITKWREISQPKKICYKEVGDEGVKKTFRRVSGRLRYGILKEADDTLLEFSLNHFNVAHMIWLSFAQI